MDNYSVCPVCRKAVRGDEAAVAAHVNSCIDRLGSLTSEQQVDVERCQICEKDISKYNPTQKAQHLNRCCDKAASSSDSRPATARSESDTSDFVPTAANNEKSCPACKKVFKSKKGVLIHTKKCPWKHNPGASGLAVGSVEGNSEDQSVSGHSPTTSVNAVTAPEQTSQFTRLTRSTRVSSRKRVKAEDEDEDTQVALALSKSLQQETRGLRSAFDTLGGKRKKAKQVSAKDKQLGAGREVPLLLQRSDSEQRAVVAARASEVILAANDADDADDPISCTPAFASSRMANVSPENSSNRILLAASTTDCIASDLSSDNDNGKKSTVGVVCQDLFAASVTLANEGEDCPTKGHEGKVVQEDLNLVPALLPANSDEVVEQSNHLAIAKPGLKHAQLSELDNVKSETVSPSWRMELELAGHAAAGDAKRSCSPVPSESRAKPLERDVLSDDGCSPLENSAKCSPNTNELREVSRSPSAHPLKHHVRVVNTSATYFDVPIAGVHLGDRHCSHQLWRLSAASCPLMTNDVFYVPSLLNDSQRHVTVEECQQVATQKRRMSPVWRKATDHAADSYSQQLLTSLAEVFSQAVPQDGADDSLGASETDKSAFEYVDPHHLSKEYVQESTENLLADLSSMIQSTKFSDAVLVADDGTRFPAHRLLLVARSPVLAQMLEEEDDGPSLIGGSSFECSGWSGLARQPAVLRFDDCCPSVLSALLAYIYTGVLPSTSASSTLKQLLAVSKRLQLMLLHSYCSEFVDKTDVLEEYGNPSLKAASPDPVCSPELSTPQVLGDSISMDTHDSVAESVSLPAFIPSAIVSGDSTVNVDTCLLDQGLLMKAAHDESDIDLVREECDVGNAAITSSLVSDSPVRRILFSPPTHTETPQSPRTSPILSQLLAANSDSDSLISVAAADTAAAGTASPASPVALSGVESPISLCGSWGTRMSSVPDFSTPVLKSSGSRSGMPTLSQLFASGDVIRKPTATSLASPKLPTTSVAAVSTASSKVGCQSRTGRLLLDKPAVDLIAVGSDDYLSASDCGDDILSPSAEQIEAVAEHSTETCDIIVQSSCGSAPSHPDRTQEATLSDTSDLFLNDAGYNCDFDEFSPPPPAGHSSQASFHGCSETSSVPCTVDGPVSQPRKAADFSLISSSSELDVDLPVCLPCPASQIQRVVSWQRDVEGSLLDIAMVDNADEGDEDNDGADGVADCMAISSASCIGSDMASPGIHDSTLLAAVELDDESLLGSHPRDLSPAATAGLQGSLHPCATPVLPARTNQQCAGTAHASSNNPITPMPNYDSMATPDVRAEADRFGIRKLPKKRTITLLKHIYDYTHPPDDPRSVRTTEALPNSACSNGEDDDGGGDDDEGTCSDGSVSDRSVADLDEADNDNEVDMSREFGGRTVEIDDIDDAMPLTATQLSAEEVEEKNLIQFFRSNKQYYEQVLLYKPLDLAALTVALRQASIRCSQRALIKFLDDKCIVFQ